MTTFKFPKFPCSHQIKRLVPLSHDFVYCDRVKIECKFRLHEFERLVTYRVDEGGQLSAVPITSYRLSDNITVLEPFSPFCDQCQSYNLNLITSLGHTKESAEKLLRGVKKYVNNKLSFTKDYNYYGRDHCYVWDIASYVDRVCDNEEELRAWVERESFEEEVLKAAPATKESIEALTRSVIKDYETTNCAVCLEELYDDDNKKGGLKVTMPCKHEFHEGCIVEWLGNSHFCPLCRFELPMEVDG